MGKGRVFGTKFRPGGFFPFHRKSLKALTGRIVPLENVLGPAGLEWVQACIRANGDEDRVGLADSFWRSILFASPALQAAGGLAHGPLPSPPVAVIAAERIQADRSILTVAQAAAAAQSFAEGHGAPSCHHLLCDV